MEEVGSESQARLQVINHAKSQKYKYENLTEAKSEELLQPLNNVLREAIKADWFFASYVRVVGHQRKLLDYNARK